MGLSSTFRTTAALLLAAGPAFADSDGIGVIKRGVPAANERVGTPDTVIDPDFRSELLAAGTDRLENASGAIDKFGSLSDGTQTEPDQNTYLVLKSNPGGPDSAFDYGRRFLFQGHENGGKFAYVTRVNLDVRRGDTHRITLLTPTDPLTGVTGFGSIDGSTYNPFTRTLLFTQEQGTSQRTGQGKVIQLSVNWPPRLNTLEAFLGLGGYEGIHLDDSGNVYIVEDIGGARNATTQAGQPNSFVYRYVPNDPRVLENGGALQALQVTVDGKPVTFHASDVNGDIMAEAQLKLHTYGASFPIKWVTIHTSHAGDTAAFDANAAAKAAGATPFKRPENLAWLPGSDFRTFFFAPTGDTNSLAGENADLAARGAWGSIFRVDLRGRSNEYGEHGERGEDSFRHRGPSNSDGEISLFVLGDREHNSFDNLTMANEKTLLAGEDRGDTLHQQLNTLDSVWAFTVKKHGSHDDDAAPKAVRFIALGRDAKAVAKGEDNEPTGVLVSNGGAGKEDLLGTERSLENARGFFTQQHGDNNLFGIFRVKGHDERASRDDDK